jgi:hypothetical protein
MTFLNPELGDEVILRRLSILLSLKAAYIKAIGQSTAFDWSRLEFNIQSESACGDDHLLQGWEFHMFKAQFGVQCMGGVMLKESYQCALPNDLVPGVQTPPPLDREVGATNLPRPMVSFSSSALFPCT